MLEVENLVVEYNAKERKRVLDNITFTLSKQKAVVVGPNGSGKSTFLKAILGLVPIKEGRVMVFGNNVKNVKNEVRVSSNLLEVYELVNLSVKDIIFLYADLKRANADEVLTKIKEVEVESILKSKPWRLSTGQQKIFGNVMALSMNSKLALLDEPFEGIDQVRRKKIAQMIQEFDGEIVMVTHEFDVLLKYFKDWPLYFMIEGKLAGGFRVSDIPRIYMNREEKPGYISKINTRYGTLSFTLNEGEVSLTSATNWEGIFEKISGEL
ncbi:ABC transporter ATP-binding protein [Candidatus Acidianus copahuensis]|uniref:ABC transporter ATP-binding protein n=1 Tax=Candidatus Acidianus copahuensis TaxID=1160895 RepID=A0A031LP83_9CREN|nr:ATP-binding cassette domain-containing protein [Candidatus Acidianus copahuensis]EZQ10182.1 ABC transporter ATP-binding protein [Candidatus Acidianus copahuensis]